MSELVFAIKPARSDADFAATAQLFSAYASGLDIDLGFQNFAAELANLPGAYAAPAGELLLARDSHGQAIGCVGLRPLGDVSLRPSDNVGLRPFMPGQACEMKRLYVSPPGRGLGLGRALVDAIFAEAVRIGYQQMRLDTLPTMAQAAALYRSMGFVQIDPYYDTPIAGTLFLARSLAG